jgi:hypothetical protein
MRYRRLALFFAFTGWLAEVALSGCKSSNTADDITASRRYKVNL